MTHNLKVKWLLVNKFNMILDNYDRLLVHDHSITSPHNELQRSLGFVQFVSPQNTTTDSGGEFGLDKVSTECKVFF